METSFSSEHPLNILLAFNTQDTRLESYLHSLDYIRIFGPVHSGTAALQYLKEQQIDIMIIDPVLSDLDGLGLLDAIAESANIRMPATFVYSSVFWDQLMNHMQQRGVIYCFIRPTPPARIIKCIFELMNFPPLDEGNSHSVIPNFHHSSFSESLEKEITAQIRAVGVPAHLKGYHYLRECIRLVAISNHPANISITTAIYPKVADKFATKAPLVERAVRHAIEVAWNRGDPDVLDNYFGYTVNDNKGKPTNAEFVAMIADRVRSHFGE